MTVLVLDGHSRAAVETVQSLGRRGIAVDVSGASESCPAFWSRYPRHRILQSSVANPEEFREWLEKLSSERGYELLVPCTEASLLGLQGLPDNDPMRRKAVFPSQSSLSIALHKQQTLELATRLGIAVPKTRLLRFGDSFTAPHQFPVVLKPVQSKLLVGGEIVTPAVEIATHQAQWQSWLERWLPLTPVQEQEYVAGRGLGVELLYRDGEKQWEFVHERIHEFPLTGGASTYRRSVAPTHPAVTLASKLLDSLRWHGVAMVEFKQSARGDLWLMEINPRLWGSLALSIDAGVDFPFGLLQIARCEDLPSQPRYRSNYYTRDLLTDIQWMKANLRSDRRDPLLLTVPPLVSLCQFARPFLGTESWDHFDVKDLGVTFKILKQIIVGTGFGFVHRRLTRWRWERTARRHHSDVLAMRNGTKLSTILFVCHGNVCRSPLAERIAQQGMPSIRWVSAGFDGKPERRSPAHMIKAAAVLGVDLSANEPRRLGAADIAGADLILVMDPENLEEMKVRFPEGMAKTTLLGLFNEPQEVRIRDPYFGTESEALAVSEQLRSCVDRLCANINAQSSTKH